jgi:hypothetical protein
MASTTAASTFSYHALVAVVVVVVVIVVAGPSTTATATTATTAGTISHVSLPPLASPVSQQLFFGGAIDHVLECDRCVLKEDEQPFPVVVFMAVLSTTTAAAAAATAAANAAYTAHAADIDVVFPTRTLVAPFHLEAHFHGQAHPERAGNVWMVAHGSQGT